MNLASPDVLVIGTGPAGLMAAQSASGLGARVLVVDSRPTAASKMLVAARGGLNVTHSEPLGVFRTRYRQGRPEVEQWLEQFGPDQVKDWIQSMGLEPFCGSSGRLYPGDASTETGMAFVERWLDRLRDKGIGFELGMEWLGWSSDSAPVFRRGGSDIVMLRPRATVMALGGGSWPGTGSNGRWLATFSEAGIRTAPLRPSNCGFNVAWSSVMKERHAGAPLKNAALTVLGRKSGPVTRVGEAVITEYGLEGSSVYWLSAFIRDEVEQYGDCRLTIDLCPQFSQSEVERRLSRPRGSRSLASFLQRQLGIEGVKAALLREPGPLPPSIEPANLAARIRAVAVSVSSPRPLAEAISSAGGVCFSELDSELMLKNLPGFFCAGEMLDWDAPTGGYLITACLSSGHKAGAAAARLAMRV